MELGSTYDEHILLATVARDEQRSLDALLWLVQRRLHSCASSPEGPAAPDTLRAAERITSASRDSKMTGWGSVGTSCRMQSRMAGWAGGCLPIRASRTMCDEGSVGSTRSFRCRSPPFGAFDTRSKAALHFPLNIRFENVLARLECV